MRSKEKKKSNVLKKLVVITLFIVCVAVVINLAPNYIIDELKDEMQVFINNNNVTLSLKSDMIINEDNVIYMSFKDIENFFDGDIYYDEDYNQIITTSDTKVAAIKVDEKEMYVNSSKVSLYETVMEKDEAYYLPISEMKDVYNIEIEYNEDTKILTIDSLDKEQKRGNSSKNASVKYMPTIFSKRVDKVQKGESVIVISEEDGWYKVRTDSGNIGYLKNITNIYNARDNMEEEKQIEGKVSLVWDYYSEYSSAPTRTGEIKGINVVSPSFASLVDEGKGKLNVNIGTAGKNYINWAHANGYKVWPMISNNSWKETTSEILNDYKLREDLINNIVNLATTYDIDGINIDFEYMKEEDKDMFSRFIIELAPRLKEYGKVLSVDVTAPDGSPDWSLCYDRYKIGQVADYIMFMAYDQYGISSTEAGTTAGADWVEVNIKKFLSQEEVAAEKLILGMPFYTRLWRETGSKAKSDVVTMKYIDSSLPSNVERVWDEDVKQYYVEYQRNGITYKMWVEDEKSITEKFKLMKEYNLAGAAYWQKDFETSNIWDVVDENINN